MSVVRSSRLGFVQLRYIAARSIIISCRCYSKDYASSSDDEKELQSAKKATGKAKSADEIDSASDSAANRLNRVLASMQTDGTYSFATKVKIAKPGEANKKLKEEVKRAASNKGVFEAAKVVANLLGGDKKQTESVLLSKLLSHTNHEAPRPTAPDENTSDDANKPIQKPNDLSLSELMVSMKIDRTSKPKQHMSSRAEYVRQSLTSNSQRKKPDFHRSNQRTAETYTGSVNLFGSEPIGIFKDISQFKPNVDILRVWAHLQEREFQVEMSHPPNNYFEKLIMWTEQGKLWRFPIDNEQDMNEEVVNEDFSDHVFLDQHLEGWCPTKGPIRHFMELVCVGLSKNPHITAKEKKDHILWYRDYFENKKNILKDVMSIQKISQGPSNEQEQLTKN